MEFKLPDIGEGVAEGEILKWMVKEGDKIREDQPLVEVMTDKVNVQIPSPRTGTVSRIMVKAGDTAKVGQPIVVITEEGEPSPAPAATGTTSPSGPTSADTIPVQTAPSATRAAQAPVGGNSPQTLPGVLATPATRKLARELGVDISAIEGSGPQGRVTDDDVRSAESRLHDYSYQQQPLPKTPTILTPRAPESTPGPVELIPLRGIRKTVAERMTRSVHTAAHVTHVDEVDMTELVLLREALKGSAEKRGVKMTYLPFVIKAVLPALKDFPYVNSSLDDANGNIVLKKYYNIGIATDTEQGLVVPVIKDADKKDIFELSGQIETLSEKARSGQLSLDEVHGSTFTITNVGAIGGLFATPIINYPEVAILGLHKIAKRPVVSRDGKIEIRDTTYLSLSFDHRVFDGAYAARFMSAIIDTIQDTKKLLSAVL
jgi:pyruvate dehydrogenase E2 component (dihydrolipoamide acetyltransferase)